MIIVKCYVDFKVMSMWTKLVKLLADWSAFIYKYDVMITEKKLILSKQYQFSRKTDFNIPNEY